MRLRGRVGLLRPRTLISDHQVSPYIWISLRFNIRISLCLYICICFCLYICISFYSSSYFFIHGGAGTPICPFWRENKFFNSFSFHLFRSMLTIINLIFSISCLFPDFLFDHQQSASGAGDNRFFELSNCSLYFLLSFYIFKSFFYFLFWSGG